MTRESFRSLWQTIRAGKSWRGEVKNRTRDGGFYWVESVVTPEFYRGKLIGYISIRQNITDKKRTEELSKENKAQQIFLRTILNAIEQFIITTDGVNIISGNKSFFDFFNVTSVEEFKGLGYSCICDTFKNRDGYLSKTVDGDNWIDYLIFHKDKEHKAIIEQDGVEHVFSVVASALYINDQFIDLVVFTNITDNEKYKLQIENILSSIVSPVLITSKRDRKIRYANPEAEIEYESKDIVGRSINDIYLKSETENRCLIRSKIESSGTIRKFETRYRTFKGREFDALLSLTGVEYNSEECYLSMVTDITEQKRREQEIAEQKELITDSIKYASYIQNAILPDKSIIKNFTKDSFQIWQPRDSVGGDIFFIDEVLEDNMLIIVADCTSHGVPGAFITMLIKAVHKQLLSELELKRVQACSPSKILQYFNREIKTLLNQKDTDSSHSNVGFDGGVLFYNQKEKIVKYAGAETPLYYVLDGEVEMIKSDRHSIGYATSDCNYKFKDFTFSTDDIKEFYITTDGYYDQVGGAKKMMFGKKRVKRLLNEIKNQSMEKQKAELLLALKEHQGSEFRRDDVTFLGLRFR
jgi:PAS domain S-box-containing protein